MFFHARGNRKNVRIEYDVLGWEMNFIYKYIVCAFTNVYSALKCISLTNFIKGHYNYGSTVLAHHLPPDGYEFGSALPVAHEAATRRWAELEALWRQRTEGTVALLLNGADHHAAQPDLAEAITALQQAAGPRAHVERTTLEEWAARLSAAAVPPSLPIVVGELRDSYGYTWTLAGTTGTRAHQKRRNARLERGLLRDVEPWLALLRLQPESAAHAPHGGTWCASAIAVCIG